jgi:hypothetical protein
MLDFSDLFTWSQAQQFHKQGAEEKLLDIHVIRCFAVGIV